MIKITAILASILILLIFSPSAFAVRDFDYYFGTLFVPSSTQISISQTVTTPSSQNTPNNPSSAQIATMQANLNQIKANLAALNSNLAKPNSNNTQIAIKGSSQVAVVSRGIPLVLDEKEKTEKSTISVFASLIPPDVKNFPLITTYLVVLTLALLGIIVYLFFTRRQEKLRIIK